MSQTTRQLPTILSIRALTAAIGAEISGIDLRDEPDGQTLAALRQALL